MAETYTVTKARYAGEKDNPHGGKLHKFYCSFVDDSGEGQSDVYWQRKSQESPEGEQFYGRIEKGEFGLRFYTEQQQNGGPPRSGGSSGAKDDYWQKKEQRDVESQARQGRAHAQEMALRWFALRNDDRPAIPAEADSLTLIIDWFHQDVQRFPTSSSQPPAANEGESLNGLKGADGPGASSGSSSGASRVGFVVKPDGSSPQKTFFDRLLKSAKLDSNQVEGINRFAEQLTTDRLSKAIDGLNSDDQELADRTVAALLRESDAWARLQSDVPWDESQ